MFLEKLLFFPLVLSLMWVRPESTLPEGRRGLPRSCFRILSHASYPEGTSRGWGHLVRGPQCLSTTLVEQQSLGTFTLARAPSVRVPGDINHPHWLPTMVWWGGSL